MLEYKPTPFACPLNAFAHDGDDDDDDDDDDGEEEEEEEEGWVNEFLRTVVKVPLRRLTAVVGNEVGLARVSVCCGKWRPYWTVGMRRRRVSTRPVGRGRVCWRDLDLIKGNEEKCSEK